MFEVGDVVVCINNEALDNNWWSIDKDYCLTMYKEYRVVLIKSDTTISIINDDGLQQPFTNKRFVSLLEFRKQKLQKICSKLVI